jgi:hypothetical protein
MGANVLICGLYVPGIVDVLMFLVYSGLLVGVGMVG